jgi:hypothetical protein
VQRHRILLPGGDGAISLQVIEQGSAQRPLLANLQDGAPDPVDVVRRRWLLALLHPFEEVAVLREAAAEGEDAAQAIAGATGEIGQETIGRAVAVA